jgi:hypothetical protein
MVESPKHQGAAKLAQNGEAAVFCELNELLQDDRHNACPTSATTSMNDPHRIPPHEKGG